MTNEEKFKEVFGFIPEEYAIIQCPKPDEICKYSTMLGSGKPHCRCYDWWQEEYTGSFKHEKRPYIQHLKAKI